MGMYRFDYLYHFVLVQKMFCVLMCLVLSLVLTMFFVAGDQVAVEEEVGLELGAADAMEPIRNYN